MKQDNFQTNIPGAQELSDQELMLIQGGGFFSDAVNWVKDKANDVVNGVSNAVQHPVDTLIKVAGTVYDVINWFAKNYHPAPPSGPGRI